MSILLYLIKSWMIGIAIAAPVGPIGMLCIRKTLEMGFLGAVAVGLGAAIADSVYGLIAALGLSAISHFLLEKAVFIKLLGGLFLLYLAYQEIKNHTQAAAIEEKTKKVGRLTVDVFILTLANPMTILSFIGIFASMGSGPVAVADSLVMVLGIFLGSMTWWLILGTAIVKIKHRLPEAWIHYISYFSAIILAAFGVWAILSILW